MRNARFALLIIVIILLYNMPVLDVSANTIYSEYTSKEGIIYKSYSQHWSTELKLKLLHEELLKNMHSQEIYKLKNINIYPDYGGFLKNEVGNYKISYRIAKNGKYEVLSDCTINLYAADIFNTIELIAGNLAKQYGKHFTQYYILKSENIDILENGLKTKYAKIRRLDEYIKDYSGKDIYKIDNIAADDYVQLYGSDLARKHNSFPNLIDQFEINYKNWTQPITSKFMYNLLPQDNLQLPLANEVDGLKEYLFDISNVTNINYSKLAKPKLYISEIKDILSKDSLFQIVFAWETINSNQKYNYTLVTYNDVDIKPMPIISYENVDSGDILIGKYGAAESKYNKVLYYNKHTGFYGKKTFVLYLSDKYGNITSSNRLTVDLSQNPIKIIDNQLGYTDLLNSDWAIDSIKVVDGYNIISGFPDKTFRPNEFVTRAEFIKMMIGVLELSNFEFNYISQNILTGNNWSIPYINKAINNNLLDKKYYNNNFKNVNFNSYISREEVVIIIANILKEQKYYMNMSSYNLNFKDIDKSLYYNEILLAINNNIIKGFPDNTFKPDSYLTRAEAAEITNRILKLRTN